MFSLSGLDEAAVSASLVELQARDVRWADGRSWAYVYHANEAVLRVARSAYAAAAPTNALSGRAFQSLAQIERELVEMAGDLLGLPSAYGSVTSGGSESIFLAMKSARDRARAFGVAGTLNAVVPSSAHPAFDKAAHYLGVELVRVPVQSDQRADVIAMGERINDRTAFVVASAPSYPHGVVDPVEAIAKVTDQRGTWLHVDACVGGFLLPFVHQLRGNVPRFDFGVEGVMSMAADLHKYGYGMKGASLVLYRDAESYDYQPFRTDVWSGGRYKTPNLTGTRPGGPMASAWAVMRFLGRRGFLDLTGQALAVTETLVAALRAVEGLAVPIDPVATLFAFTSSSCDVSVLAKSMRGLGWHMGVQGPPPSIHLSVSPGHARAIDEFMSDLRRMVAEGSAGAGADAGAIPVYGS